MAGKSLTSMSGAFTVTCTNTKILLNIVSAILKISSEIELKKCFATKTTHSFYKLY